MDSKSFSPAKKRKTLVERRPKKMKRQDSILLEEQVFE
jgi:hypothetical protein